MADIWRDFWIRETGTGQKVAQLHDIYDDDDDNWATVFKFIFLSNDLAAENSYVTMLTEQWSLLVNVWYEDMRQK